MSRIFIVGSGVVGGATGRGFAQAGHRVTFVDTDPARVAFLRGQGLDAQSELVLAGEPESFIFLTLPTPNVGHAYDLSAIRAGSASVGRALTGSSMVHTVVVRSTVPPGTSEQIVAPAVAEASGLVAGSGFLLAANPEFLRAASAEEDFRWPWMTVVGARSKRVQERLVDLLAPFGGQMRVFDNPATAELAKCAHNIYNAAKISFWNEMWLVCQELGIDHDLVSGTVADSAEASFNRQYGIRGGAPYGGVCLPKDTQGFLGFAADLGVRMPLLEAVVEVNDTLTDRVSQEMDRLSRQTAQPDEGPAEERRTQAVDVRDSVISEHDAARVNGNGHRASDAIGNRLPHGLHDEVSRQTT